MANKKTVVIIDGGGRGSALVYKYSQSPLVKQIIAIPGNDLMALNSNVTLRIFPKLKTTSIIEILTICKKYKADLIDVAQDSAIEAGLVDALIENGFNVIGPTRLAGQIEWDKAWARKFMQKYNLPIPKYKVCKNQAEGINFINQNSNKKWFIKASGLAEGKGVIEANNKNEAIEAINSMRKFGKAGNKFIIEQALIGEEFSAFAICDGVSVKIIGFAQDHKKMFTGDVGPNTGGMGCITPTSVVTNQILFQTEKIIERTIIALRQENRPYKGILYLGAILVGNKVYIIEFNARWGDPEAQVILPGIKNDFFKLCESSVRGDLLDEEIKVDEKVRIVVVGVLRDNLPAKNREIFGIEKILKLPDILIFGTRIKQVKNKFYVTSGRLFHVVAVGKDITEARQKVYEALSFLYVEDNGLTYRTDIGWREVSRFQKK